MASREYNSPAADALAGRAPLPQTGRGGTNLGPGHQDRRSRGLAPASSLRTWSPHARSAPAAAL